MESRKSFSNARLARKVDWEGGVLAALEYGIRADDIEDPKLRALWEQVERRYESLSPLVSEINVELRNAA